MVCGCGSSLWVLCIDLIDLHDWVICDLFVRVVLVLVCSLGSVVAYKRQGFFPRGIGASTDGGAVPAAGAGPAQRHRGCREPGKPLTPHPLPHSPTPPHPPTYAGTLPSIFPHFPLPYRTFLDADFPEHFPGNLWHTT